MFIIKFIKSYLVNHYKQKCPYSHKPNKKTKKSIEEAEKGKGLTEYKSSNDLFKKLDI